IDGKMQFYIAKGSTKIDSTNPESRKSGAGTYTLYLEAANAQEKLSNYNIRYYGKDADDKYILNDNGERITNANLNVFRISKRQIVVDWRMSGNGWDGMNFVYNDDAPIVQPYVNAYREARTYDATSVGEGTQDGYAAGLVENYVAGDTIELVEQRLSGSTVGDYTTARTSLSAQKDIDNYVLVNAVATYHIVQREVKINIKDRTAVYGNAKTTVSLGRLGRVDAIDANWAYNEDTQYRFVEGSDHYTNWTLSSSAISGATSDYHGVGEYDIVLAVTQNGGAIASNYSLVIYRQHLDGTVEESTFANAAKFIITEAELSLARNEFNFDADNDDEVCAISIDDIKNVVRVIGNNDTEIQAERDSLTITMYEAKLYSGENPDEFDENASTVNEININMVGRYYVWISISGHNYTNINITVDVNYLTNWVSIKLNGYIEANYGDAVYTSNQLFTNLKVDSVIGVWDADTQNYYQDTEEGRADAWAAIRSRGYFTLYVDGLKTTNSKVGTYSVFMNVASNVVDYKGDELNFRFVGEEVGKGATSNVDVYHVIPRPIYIAWGDLNEIYGEHGENSNSHKNFDIMNVLPGDRLTKDMLDIEYTASNGGGLKGDHIHYVGDYTARLVGVNHDNYRVARVGDRIPLGGSSGTKTIT
ncbi:MAG: hypothetical protein K2J13_02445, partial [Clostridia bacterium]|nr:hypothetical protein [Clostridia bacterium]